MNLFVGNLNPDTTVTNLRNLFSEFGEIVSAKVIYDNATGMSRGFGFVEMGDRFMAFDAIDNLDATFFEGNIISVKEAKQSNTKPGGFHAKKSRPRTAPRPGMKYNPNQNRFQNPNRITNNNNNDLSL